MQMNSNKKYVRFLQDSRILYGSLQDTEIEAVTGDPLRSPASTGMRHRLADVKLLAPVVPPKILAVGRNYQSHLNGRHAPETPEIFYKPVTSLQNPGDPIVLPRDARNAHFEGELVIVMGRTISKASKSEAEASIFGVTCGNDVSERNWQNGNEALGIAKDLQWWRAKGSDTFAPLGPTIATGLDYGNLRLQTRVNGDTLQDQTTADLIFDLPTIVSWISQWVTLTPGDVIYTGTPGNTRALQPGDVVEVEIEGIGILRNPVVAE